MDQEQEIGLPEQGTERENVLQQILSLSDELSNFRFTADASSANFEENGVSSGFRKGFFRQEQQKKLFVTVISSKKFGEFGDILIKPSLSSPENIFIHCEKDKEPEVHATFVKKSVLGIIKTYGDYDSDKWNGKSDALAIVKTVRALAKAGNFLKPQAS
jgi:hypothetical protein